MVLNYGYEYDEDPGLALAGSLDSRGKAMFGTPGPGTYKPATLFRPAAAQLPAGDDDCGRLVYPTGPAYSLKGRWKDQDAKAGCPGPDHYGAPSIEQTVAIAGSASFGSANRDSEAKRFMSTVHARDIPRDVPGPGSYRERQGKGFAKTMGDAPTWKFGTTKQRPDADVQAQDSKFYDLPPEMGGRDGPAAVFAPCGDRERGLQRNRSESDHLFISKMHCESQTDSQLTQAPAPGAYHTENYTQMSQHARKERATFGTGLRGTDYKPNLIYVAKAFEDIPGNSPGPEYDVEAPKDRRGPVFGTAKKTYDPELGGNLGGPFISQAHNVAVVGCDSPGPAEYEPPLPTKGGSLKFGTGPRPALNAGMEGKAPGPGAYQPKKDTAYYNYAQTGSYSIASNLRTDFTAQGGCAENPGPGQYSVDTGIARPHPGKKVSPGCKFGVRYGDQGGDQVPGPGAYKQSQSDTLKNGKGYSFGCREHVPARSRNGQPIRYRGAGTDKESLGLDSPGPQYGVRQAQCNQPGAQTQNYKFGTGARVNEKVFISRAHSDQASSTDSPGPGSYVAKISATSKFRGYGGASFGTSVRPPLATVKF